MSAHYPSDQEEDAAELTSNPGRRLHAARQAQGLTLDRVAAELHLSAAMIESIERDDYDALPGPVFIIGYIRKYARVVGLDPEPLLAAYHRAAPQTGRTWLRPRAKPRNAGQVGSGHLVVRLISIAILILLFGLAFVWWQNQPPEDDLETVDTGTDTEQEAPEPAMPKSISEAPAPSPVGSVERAAPDAPQAPADPPSAPKLSGAVAPELEPQTEVSVPAPLPVPPAGDAGGAQNATADAAAPIGNAEEAESAKPGEILMIFDGPCWVDVRDSERKYKLFGEMKKGDRHVLAGTPPYSVILGNAAAVEITVDGTTFDLSTVSQGNVARFTLDPSKTP